MATNIRMQPRSSLAVRSSLSSRYPASAPNTDSMLSRREATVGLVCRWPTI